MICKDTKKSITKCKSSVFFIFFLFFSPQCLSVKLKKHREIILQFHRENTNKQQIHTSTTLSIRISATLSIRFVA